MLSADYHGEEEPPENAKEMAGTSSDLKIELVQARHAFEEYNNGRATTKKKGKPPA